MKGEIMDTPNLDHVLKAVEFYAPFWMDTRVIITGHQWDASHAELAALKAENAQQADRIVELETKLAAIKEAERKRNINLAFLLGEE